MVKRQKVTKQTPAKKQRNPRVPTAREYSRDAVVRSVENLVGLGFTRDLAWEMIATQLHENLLQLKKETK